MALLLCARVVEEIIRVVEEIIRVAGWGAQTPRDRVGAAAGDARNLGPRKAVLNHILNELTFDWSDVLERLAHG